MIRNALDAISFVTVKGIIIPNEKDKEKLLLLMRRFTWACRRATTVLWKECGSKEAYKSAYEILKDYVYAESAVKQAKLILKGAKVNDGNLTESKEGFTSFRGEVNGKSTECQDSKRERLFQN